MTSSERLCAKLSNEVYKIKPKAIAGYTPRSRKTFGECKFEYVVFVNAFEQKVVLAFRGTASVTDLAIDIFDIALLVGGVCQSAARLLDKVLSHYKNCQVICTGHSLGGYLAAKAIQHQKSERAAGPHHAFNPGSGMFRDSAYNNARLQCHHVVGDVLSTTCGADKRIYKCKTLNPHSIDNFLS